MSRLRPYAPALFAGNGDLRCEKCERDREQLYDLNPVARIQELEAKVQGNAADLLSAWGQLEEKDARIKELEEERDEAMNPNSTGWAAFAEKERQRNEAQARIQHLERALREIDQNTRLSVAELRAIARAAITNANADLLAVLEKWFEDDGYPRYGALTTDKWLDMAAIDISAAIAKAKGEES